MKIEQFAPIDLKDVPQDARVINEVLRMADSFDDETGVATLHMYYLGDEDGLDFTVTRTAEESNQPVTILAISNEILASVFANKQQGAIPAEIADAAIQLINIANGKLAEAMKKNEDRRHFLFFHLVSGQALQTDIRQINWAELGQHTADIARQADYLRELMRTLVTNDFGKETTDDGETIETTVEEYVEKKLNDILKDTASFDADYSMFANSKHCTPKELLMIKLTDQIHIQEQLLRAVSVILQQNEMRNFYEAIIDGMRKANNPEDAAEEKPLTEEVTSEVEAAAE